MKRESLTFCGYALLMANLLILTPQLPYPPQQGTSLRNYHIIRGLAGRHDITLLTFLEANETVDPQAIAPLLELCKALIIVPAPTRSLKQRLLQLLTTRRPDMAHRLASPFFDDQLRHLLSESRFDIVQIEGIELAPAIETIRQVNSVTNNGSRIVFDDHNAETELQRRNFVTDLAKAERWPAAAYSWVQIGRLRRFETWACRQADWVTAVSEADRRYLRSLVPEGQTSISVIPNCIDVSEYDTYQLFSGSGGKDSAPKAGKPVAYDLVFTGKMDYRPNVDAVLWFADAIWPLIRRERPATTWAVVGQKPHPRLARLRSLEGVTMTGWVEDVKPYLAKANVYIMPFRIGSGTRLKLIEAMAAGKAIVSTATGAEGFPVQHNRELLLAERPDEVAAAVLHLLSHPQERQQLGEAARRFAQQYDWRAVTPAFDAIYQQLLQASSGAS
ncbi:MAG TPA: glycosyltransferase [Anaerolineae bacterium]